MASVIGARGQTHSLCLHRSLVTFPLKLYAQYRFLAALAGSIPHLGQSVNESLTHSLCLHRSLVTSTLKFSAQYRVF